MVDGERQVKGVISGFLRYVQGTEVCVRKRGHIWSHFQHSELVHRGQPSLSGIRIPRIQARPPMIFGSNVIRSNISIAALLTSRISFYHMSATRSKSLTL